eukprot:951612_1
MGCVQSVQPGEHLPDSNSNNQITNEPKEEKLNSQDDKANEIRYNQATGKFDNTLPSGLESHFNPGDFETFVTRLNKLAKDTNKVARRKTTQRYRCVVLCFILIGVSFAIIGPLESNGTLTNQELGLYGFLCFRIFGFGMMFCFCAAACGSAGDNARFQTAFDESLKINLSSEHSKNMGIKPRYDLPVEGQPVLQAVCNIIAFVIWIKFSHISRKCLYGFEF